MGRRLLIFALSVLCSCGTTKQFVAIPVNLETDKIPHQVVEMTAEDFHFTPEDIHCKTGTLVTLRITAIGTHGFKLSAFGIDERLEDQQTKVIEFYAAEKGEYGFKCSHFCGIGHFGMTGKIIVE